MAFDPISAISQGVGSVVSSISGIFTAKEKTKQAEEQTHQVNAQAEAQTAISILKDDYSNSFFQSLAGNKNASTGATATNWILYVAIAAGVILLIYFLTRGNDTSK